MKKAADSGNTIRFSEHRIASRTFQALYDEGMELVEETASYLDEEGREEAKKLPRAVATLYAAESMRLTTRLMQLASWLLLQRALRNGEMTREQVEAEKAKIRLNGEAQKPQLDLWNGLPQAFRTLVERSHALEARVRRVDSGDAGEQEPEAARDNPVSAQVNLLKTAFGSR